METKDPHSFAAPQAARVTHLKLALAINFELKLLSGTASYSIERLPGVNTIILDTKEIQIKAVWLNNKTAGSYELGEENHVLGRPLIINLLPDTTEIIIDYHTTDRSAALQWLDPEQTAGGHYPFLFTQSQAILARTWLPCQDSPAIRFTYEAQVKVPAGYLALMSAQNPVDLAPEGLYHFNMPYPIPAYLMALSVGQLQFAPIGLRTGIYAEPTTLKAAVDEFADLEKMLVAAETLYGDYPWGRYDLLILPPSFPFGGMENPCLTFVTPTIITGDQSLTSLVAHELAHSWSGNLVTNASWNDFWLNEGFTVYFERRIMEFLYGAEYADMLKVLGYQDLLKTIQDIGETNPDTCLKLNLSQRDPDEGLTEIAYEKGNLFLLTLEKAVGRNKFDEFINHYFSTFQFTSNTTENFLKFLFQYFINDQETIKQQVQPQVWIYQPGIPEIAVKVSSVKFDTIKNRMKDWQETQNTEVLETASWSTHEWLFFLHEIQPVVNTGLMHLLDKAFCLSESNNAEIKAAWLQMALEVNYRAAFPYAVDFLTKVGRRKFVLPLYKLLTQTNEGKKVATEVYLRARPNYHAVTRQSVEALLK